MEAGKPRHYTLLIMPDSSGLEVRRIRVSRAVILSAAVLGVLFVAFTIGSLAYSFMMFDASQENERLHAENTTLRANVESIDGRLAEVDDVVQRLKQFDDKLRRLAMISDPGRNLAIGPVGEPSRHDEDGAKNNLDVSRNELLAHRHHQDAVELVKRRLSIAESEAGSVQGSVRELSLLLEGQRALLSATPSRRPTLGYVTSTFGMRVDPFTGLAQMHGGIDFSANVGTRVVAPADGVVIGAAKQGAYGNLVQVAHGNGLVTRYAHLSRMDVKVGDEVTRGDMLGAVGNTGRSTGPHLHYEIRLNGVIQDPERFLLE